jgi:hypothetical protein
MIFCETHLNCENSIHFKMYVKTNNYEIFQHR